MQTPYTQQVERYGRRWHRPLLIFVTIVALGALLWLSSQGLVLPRSQEAVKEREGSIFEVKKGDDDRFDVKFKNAPASIQALRMAPEKREPELAKDTWLVLVCGVFSVPDIKAINVALDIAEKYGKKIKIGVRPFREYSEIKKWFPEYGESGQSPVWIVFKDGKTLGWTAALAEKDVTDFLDKTLAKASPAAARANEPIQSGPQLDQKGFKGPFPFYVRHLSGPHAGKSARVDSDLRIQPKPSVFVFSRATSEPVLRLARELNAEGARSNIFVSMVFFPDTEELVKRLAAFIEKEKIGHACVCVTKGDLMVKTWSIAKEAEVTVVLYNVSRELSANFAFRAGDVNDKAAATILKRVVWLASTNWGAKERCHGGPELGDADEESASARKHEAARQRFKAVGGGLFTHQETGKDIWLHLEEGHVTDADLKYVQDLRRVDCIVLYSTRVTDAGLAHLKDLQTLKHIHLNNNRISDAGLAHVKGLAGLEELYVGNTNISDAGLSHLAGLRNLKTLWLHQTKITDKGLKEIQKLASLMMLRLDETRVTEKGVEELKRALPKCSVQF